VVTPSVPFPYAPYRYPTLRTLAIRDIDCRTPVSTFGAGYSDGFSQSPET